MEAVWFFSGDSCFQMDFREVEVVEVEVTMVDVEVVAMAEVVAGTVKVEMKVVMVEESLTIEVEGVDMVAVVREDLGGLVEVVKKLWPTGGQLSKIRS